MRGVGWNGMGGEVGGLDWMDDGGKEKMRKMESMVSAPRRLQRVSATKNLHGDFACHMTNYRNELNFSLNARLFLFHASPLHTNITPTSPT